MTKTIKGLFFAFIGLLLVATLASCNGGEEGPKALTHEEYIAAELDSEVVIEAYIQGKQSWWQNKGTFYLQDDNGGYFVYELPCTEEEYNTQLVVGNKIRVTGIKGEWSGEVEILGSQAGAEATWEVLKGTKIYTATDVTSHLGKDSLVNYQNMLVSFKNLTVVAQADGTSAFYYKWDNSGSQGDDVYVSFTDGTTTITCCVESYLTDKNTAVYKAVEALKVGDKVDLEGFLYWYNGAQPHITNVTTK